MGCFVNVCVIFGYAWEEMLFVKGFAKFREITNIDNKVLKLEFVLNN